MARARNIKPSLFKNEILGVADPLYTILFEGLWVLADKEGRLEDRPLRIKAEILPYREGINIVALLDWLEQNGFIKRYCARGIRCIVVLNFAKHQNPHKNETESELPAPPDEGNELGACTEKIGSRPDSNESARADSLNLIPDSLKPSLRSGQDEPAANDADPAGEQSQTNPQPQRPAQPPAAEPPHTDPDAELHAAVWSEGLPLLTEKGVGERSARSLLGKLCKAAGDLEALAVVEAMRAADPGDPSAWLSAAIKVREKANAGTSFAEFAAACRERGEPVISAYAPLLAYVRDAAIPMEFVEVAWAEFKRRHMVGGTWAQARREDWRRSFLIAVERNAMRLWAVDRASGQYVLTSLGLQTQLAVQQARPAA